MNVLDRCTIIVPLKTLTYVSGVLFLVRFYTQVLIELEVLIAHLY